MLPIYIISFLFIYYCYYYVTHLFVDKYYNSNYINMLCIEILSHNPRIQGLLPVNELWISFRRDIVYSFLIVIPHFMHNLFFCIDGFK